MVVSVVILAAGLSRRMGVFKALLPVGGTPAVLKCVRTAESAGVGDVVVVTGSGRDKVESAVGGLAPGARLVYNDRFAEGMFSSVCAGVSALHADDLDGFFLLPADCCAFSPDALTTLIGRFSANGGRCVTRPVFQGRRGHPPLVPARYIDPLCSYSGENGLKGFLRTLPTDEVEMDGPDTLFDMDTPEDYAALLGHLGLPSYPGPGQCAELLAKQSTPAETVRHGEQVAEFALRIAGMMNARGASIDTGLLGSACRLHDIKRAEPDHARVGMELLLREGYPGAAILVGCHMDMHADMQGGAPQDVGEAELLFLADKMCRRGKIVAPEAVMREIEIKFPKGSEAYANAMSRMAAAQAILAALRERYGVVVEG